VLFCVVAPVACVWLDRHLGMGGTVLNMTPGGPAVGLLWIAQLMLASGTWILLRPASALLAGGLAACSLWAGVFGLAILPLSLIALLLGGLGLFGLAPLLAAWRCARSSRATLAAATVRTGRRRALRRAALGFMLGLALPFSALGLGAVAERGLERILADPTAEVPGALLLVRPLLTALGDDPAESLAEEWFFADDLARQERLADAYRRVTGRDVETSPRIGRLMD
jgi:hypothetical protein